MYFINKRKEIRKVEGLHIFSQAEIYALPTGYIGAVIGIGILLGLPSSILAENCKNNLVRIVSMIILALTMTGVMIFGCGWQMFQQPTGKYEYTASIDENKVKLIEFNKKYEIERQEGSLWIIKDK
jgi:hypothetical protein